MAAFDSLTEKQRQQVTKLTFFILWCALISLFIIAIFEVNFKKCVQFLKVTLPSIAILPINNTKNVRCTCQLNFILTLQDEEIRKKMDVDQEALQSANEQIAALKAELEEKQKEIAQKDNEKKELLQRYKTKDPERKSKIRSHEMKVDEPNSKLEERERSMWVEEKIHSLHYMVNQKNTFWLRI